MNYSYYIFLFWFHETFQFLPFDFLYDMTWHKCIILIKSCFIFYLSKIFNLSLTNHQISTHFFLNSPEDHGAVLPVEGKVVDSDGASAAVDGRRQPVHTAIRRHQCVAVKRHLKLSIHTVQNTSAYAIKFTHKIIFLDLFVELWETNDAAILNHSCSRVQHLHIKGFLMTRRGWLLWIITSEGCHTHLFSSITSGSQMLLEGTLSSEVMLPYRADLGGWSHLSLWSHHCW